MTELPKPPTIEDLERDAREEAQYFTTQERLTWSVDGQTLYDWHFSQLNDQGQAIIVRNPTHGNLNTIRRIVPLPELQLKNHRIKPGDTVCFQPPDHSMEDNWVMDDNFQYDSQTDDLAGTVHKKSDPRETFPITLQELREINMPLAIGDVVAITKGASKEYKIITFEIKGVCSMATLVKVDINGNIIDRNETISIPTTEIRMANFVKQSGAARQREWGEIAKKRLKPIEDLTTELTQMLGETARRNIASGARQRALAREIAGIDADLEDRKKTAATIESDIAHAMNRIKEREADFKARGDALALRRTALAATTAPNPTPTPSPTSPSAPEPFSVKSAEDTPTPTEPVAPPTASRMPLLSQQPQSIEEKALLERLARTVNMMPSYEPEPRPAPLQESPELSGQQKILQALESIGIHPTEIVTIEEGRVLFSLADVAFLVDPKPTPPKIESVSDYRHQENRLSSPLPLTRETLETLYETYSEPAPSTLPPAPDPEALERERRAEEERANEQRIAAQRAREQEEEQARRAKEAADNARKQEILKFFPFDPETMSAEIQLDGNAVFKFAGVTLTIDGQNNVASVNGRSIATPVPLTQDAQRNGRMFQKILESYKKKFF